MIDSYLQEKIEKHLVAPLLISLPKSPNLLTLLALFSGLAIPLTLYLHIPGLALTLLLLSGALDALDGPLARHLQCASPKGAAFDIVSDRTVEFSVVLGFYLFDPARALLCILMLGSMLICITSFLVVGIFSKGESRKSFYYSPGIMERGEAFIFFAWMIVFPHSFDAVSVLFSSLCFFTGFFRLFQFWRHSR